MAKRSVLDEIQIAALAAAIELVKNPEYSREWLRKEFAEREIKSVRMTDDILDAVEFALTNNLSHVAAQMKQRLEEGIKHADSVDPDETPAMKRVKQILANSEDPAAIAFLAGEKVTPELDEVLDPSDEDAEVSQDPTRPAYAEKFDAWFKKCLENIKAEELAKGNSVSDNDAAEIIRKRLYV